MPKYLERNAYVTKKKVWKYCILVFEIKTHFTPLSFKLLFSNIPQIKCSRLTYCLNYPIANPAQNVPSFSILHPSKSYSEI